VSSILPTSTPSPSTSISGGMIGGIVAGAATVLIVGILAVLIYKLKSQNGHPTGSQISGRTMWNGSPDAPERLVFLEDDSGTLTEREERTGAPRN